MKTVEEILYLDSCMVDLSYLHTVVSVLVHDEYPVSPICKHSIHLVIHELLIKLINDVIGPLQFLPVLTVQHLHWQEELEEFELEVTVMDVFDSAEHKECPLYIFL